MAIRTPELEVLGITTVGGNAPLARTTRNALGLLEHVAVLIGRREGWPDPLPVRLHSACLTGDLFGSLRCDCCEFICLHW